MTGTPREKVHEPLFVYGTLRSGADQHDLLDGATAIGEATWPGRLYGVAHYPGAVPSSDPRDSVRGEVYALAPTSTVDLSTPSGDQIPIEYRSAEEIRRGFGTLTAPEEATVWSPAFDVTPAELVAGIVTEQGIHRPPYEKSLADAVARAHEERDLAAS